VHHFSGTFHTAVVRTVHQCFDALFTLKCQVRVIGNASLKRTLFRGSTPGNSKQQQQHILSINLMLII
jgi:hypothetical protein